VIMRIIAHHVQACPNKSEVQSQAHSIQAGTCLMPFVFIH
jgi:hypothetical protein